MTDLLQCSKCHQMKTTKGFHSATCYTCRRDIWRQNKGLPPIIPENLGIHLASKMARKIKWGGLKRPKPRKVPRLNLTREKRQALTREIRERQNDRCAICSCDLATTQACLDHCHDTKVIRGVLCRSCNTALGLFKDSKEILETAIHYIQRARTI